MLLLLIDLQLGFCLKLSQIDILFVTGSLLYSGVWLWNNEGLYIEYPF